MNIRTLMFKLMSCSLVPTPNVIVTALNNQQVGDPLLLECNVTTVRGITSSVDIVWITNDEVVRRVNNVSWETVDNSVVYNDTYNNGSILSEDDDGTVYQCKVEINTTPLVSSISTFVGESVCIISICIVIIPPTITSQISWSSSVYSSCLCGIQRYASKFNFCLYVIITVQCSLNYSNLYYPNTWLSEQ